MTDFSKTPVIIEGVNHSGTRLLVEILSIFGSNGGDCNSGNKWKENSFFLDVHKQMIDNISDKGWTETILNIDFISNYEDDLSQTEYIVARLDNELEKHYPNYKTELWHWKCPTSALFENTWTNIYPDAFYIINRRDPGKIAKAFMRRRGIASLSFKEGVQYYHIMEKRIFSVKKRHQLIIDFDNLKDEIPRIISFLPVQVTKEQIELANSKINYKNHKWNPNLSLLSNIKNKMANLTYELYRKGLILRNYKP